MKKTLLLADDSPTIQKVINLTFADEGIDVISVGDGNAAIQQLRELTPDLVMADVHMPGLNGYQICERIRQNAELSKVPVILLVGSFEPFDEEEAKRVGADDFLMKPFQSIRQLVSRVAALLDTAPGETESFAESGSPAETHAAASITPEDTFHAPWPEDSSEAVTVETTLEEISGEDDLSDFDSEFDRTFPDAASLSSEFIDITKFAAREETAPEPVPEAAPEAAEFAEDTEQAEEILERVHDEDEEPASISAEPAPILDLGYPGAPESVSESEALLEISGGEPIVPAEQAPIPLTAEPDVEKIEASEPEPEPEQYDFRQPDAFDDDADIRESFHGVSRGLPVLEEKPDLSSRPPEQILTPLERISDAAPSEVSTDQADGFSAAATTGSEAAPAPQQIAPEAIEAIAQRVFEKLSEKMVKEMVPEMKDLIARELTSESSDKDK